MVFCLKNYGHQSELYFDRLVFSVVLDKDEHVCLFDCLLVDLTINVQFFFTYLLTNK